MSIDFVLVAALRIPLALPLAVKDWLQPAVAGAVALIALIGVIISTVIQRRTGRETSAAATRSAEAAERASKASEKSADAAQVSATSSERSSRAAEEAVDVNRETAAGVARRAEADALAKRYQDVATQLGHDKPAVRLAGVYAMARLADDLEDQQQTCIDVLCAYLRMPAPTVESHGTLVADPGDLRVRDCIWSVIRNRLLERARPSWRDFDFDFSGAAIRNADLVRVAFDRFVNFEDARFLGEGRLTDVLFSAGASFNRSRIEGKLHLSDVRSGHILSTTLDEIQVTRGSELSLHTNAREVAAEDGAIALRHAVVEGTVSVYLEASKWKQPSLQAWAIRLRPDSEVRIQNGLNLSKNKDVVHRPLVKAYNWRLEPPCKVDIAQSLINEGTVDWSTSHDEIPEGVSLTFRPRGGEIST